MEKLMRARAAERQTRGMQSIRDQAAQLRRNKAVPVKRKRDDPPAAEERQPATKTLPAGFFDGEERHKAVPAGEERHKALPAGEEKHKALLTGEERHKTAPAGEERHQALPPGFFDEKEKQPPGFFDGKDSKDDWDEFQAFAGGVVADEAREEEDEAVEIDEVIERRRLEQAWYERYRLAPVLDKSYDKADVDTDAHHETLIRAALQKQHQTRTPPPILDDEDDDDPLEALTESWRKPSLLR